MISEKKEIGCLRIICFGIEDFVENVLKKDKEKCMFL